ncbi:hypothetical protein FEM48_Zijuj01G0113200 [Ziziphus jujuba var. spinosa]|uniref:non-specific serine/threonine protein kinase n=1 Tax=Ziziphus jujuba var. spinosa TaxID=714518 RepID=A0A978W0Z0_ZIZJJ|nr:hypothetical protein FEM48_Zijuj01G0113200 [Ziziphus jujuba var. spinosa]
MSRSWKKLSSPPPSYLLCWWLCFFLSPWNSITQNSATLVPSEVRALNSLFEKWDVQTVGILWNISGEPCSGSAIDDTPLNASKLSIKCECGNENNTTQLEDSNLSVKCCGYENNTCHITQLRIDSLSKTGEIPEEITTFKYLNTLHLDWNFFTGPLPAFIGNLSQLTKLSIFGNAFSGSIPKELGNLKHLTFLSFGINNFSGTLPPELGNLVKLEQLFFNSAGVSGEIPSTFANLRNMRIMWASDSAFSGKIPDFIGNWTKLTDLRFQGNSFEGPIPSSFSQLTSLNSLRISDIYNVRSSLNFIKNLKNLTVLVLRNALINGTIPSDIGEFQNLQILDLSFNNLKGQLPSALFNMSSLTHLLIHSSNILFGFVMDAALLVPLERLDFLETIVFLETFQYKRVINFRLFANFSIHCGGRDMSGTVDGILYEADDTTLGPAKFYLSDIQKWAISNAGLFLDRKDPLYSVNTTAQITGFNVTPELFQTARMSPGSLRYYGLGLENGRYTIIMQFAEIGFDDRSSQTWKSLGRRVFDIYIQGHLELKDFDISREAGGVLRAVVKNFNVTVTENYLDVHLFWAGKGTSFIPDFGYYGPLISTIRAVSDFHPSGLPLAVARGKSRTWLIVGIAVPVGILFLVLAFAVFYMSRKTVKDDEELFELGTRTNTVTYAELRAATEDFNSSNKLGEGGYGPVYKGTLSDGRAVAVKQLSVASPQGKSQFITEIDTITAVQHRNLVKLYGCCIEGSRRILVYEYLENKSVDQALFEYAMRGHLTEKADVFSFGVVALEILSGRPNSDNSLDCEKIYLLEWAWTLREKKQSLGLVDPRLTEFDEDEATRVIGVALLCTQASPMMRPAMSRVVGMLTGDIELDTSGISKPSYLTDWNFKDTTMSFLEEEDSTPLTKSMESNSNDKIQHGTTTSSSPGVDISPSPVNVTEAMFSDIIKDGRRVYALDKTGVIPEEITAFKYLAFLKLDQNYFTGPLPAFIGNLSALQLLSISINAFSGTIPKELGNLKDLNMLAFGSNNFSGTLPPELGNLLKLEQIYMDSAGVGGEIPSTFSNLRNMQIMWASDNPFTGKIPDFIGNWTKLTTLRFQGNSFGGPIPYSFSQLASLNSLRISDIYDVSSSLNFINNLKNLTDLVLRNALINGSIPSDIGEYQSLQILDLSFNNLKGELPNALFNMSSLANLYLGNNSLSGNLPRQKSDTLQTIDLSYNYLSGSFPSWVSSISELYVYSFIMHANFSIKCGGPEMKASNGITYEADNSSLGPAMFYLSSTEKWGISNVGFFADRQAPQYFENTLTQVTGTDLTPELFQTARMSPGSLRYYGLGLENGSYTITLQFAEIGFEDRSSQTWKSLGRRVFDIYIQGRRRLKDFDISKEAGGVNRVTERKFNVTVTENYLDIHLFWAGKGTCCIPSQGYYGPLISTVRAAPDFTPTVSGLPPTIVKGRKNRTGLVVGIAVPVGILGFMLGTLSDGRVVAVKQLSVASHQGKNQFITEIDTISAVQHRNLVKLFGCCIEGNRRILVYEYLENKSVDQALFAITYDPCRGYLAPEYAMRGHLTEKADVFSFGVVALEILSGRPNSDNSLDSEKIFLLEWAWTLHERKQTVGLVDPRLTEFDEDEATRMIGVALLCTQASPMMRPAMSRVVGMLAGDIGIDTSDVSKPSYLTDWNFKDVTRSFLEEEDPTPSATSKDSKSHDNIQHGNPTSSSPAVDISPSPVNVTETMFSDIIKDGR